MVDCAIDDARAVVCPGFLEFHLLRRPERDDQVLCSSHTVWASKAALPDGRSPNIFARPS